MMPWQFINGGKKKYYITLKQHKVMLQTVAHKKIFFHEVVPSEEPLHLVLQGTRNSSPRECDSPENHLE